MNFKFVLLLLFVAGCGVKGDPITPKSERMPSLLDNYPDIQLKQPINESGPQGKKKKR